MVVVAQLVRASVCGTEGRGFESRLPPIVFKRPALQAFFFGILQGFENKVFPISTFIFQAVLHSNAIE